MEVMKREITSCGYDRLNEIIEQASVGRLKDIIESALSDDMKFGAICIYLWTSSNAGIYTEIQEFIRQNSLSRTLNVGLNPADQDSRLGPYRTRCLKMIIEYIIKYINSIDRLPLPPATKPCCDEYMRGNCKLFYRWQKEDFGMKYEQANFSIFQGFTATSDDISSAANISFDWGVGPHKNPILFVIECSNEMEQLYLSIDQMSAVPCEKEFLFIPSLVSELTGVYACLPSEMKSGFKIPCSPESQTYLDFLKPMGHGAERIFADAENINIIHLRVMGFYKNGLSEISININLPDDLDASEDIETALAPEAPATPSPEAIFIEPSDDKPGFTKPYFSTDVRKGEEDNSFSLEGLQGANYGSFSTEGLGLGGGKINKRKTRKKKTRKKKTRKKKTRKKKTRKRKTRKRKTRKRNK